MLITPLCYPPLVLTNGTQSALGKSVPEVKSPPVYIGVDTETSGLDDTIHGLLQIGAVATDSEGFMLDVFKQDCNPGARVEYDAQALTINGFTPERIGKAAATCLVARNFGLWLAQYPTAVLVFHNAPFDVGFLKTAFRNEGISLDHFRRVRDTATMSPDVFGESDYPRSLKYICDKLEIRNPHEHDAFSDANATIMAFHLMRKMLEQRRLHACSQPRTPYYPYYHTGVPFNGRN